MYSKSFPLAHYDALNRYRLTLQNAEEMTKGIKADLGLKSDPVFIRLHQPSLDHTFIQVKGQLANWADLLNWPYRIFYQQSDLVADIKRLNSDLNAVVAAMRPNERRGFLSTFDFSQPPFALAGQLKLFTPTLGLPFAQKVKQTVEQLWQEYDRAAFNLDDLDLRVSLVLPPLIRFMQAAIKAYAAANNLDAEGNDRRIVAVRLMINTMDADSIKLAYAIRQLSAGYAELAFLLSESARQFTNIFTSTTLQQFQEKLKAAVVCLETAEAKLRPTH